MTTNTNFKRRIKNIFKISLIFTKRGKREPWGKNGSYRGKRGLFLKTKFLDFLTDMEFFISSFIDIFPLSTKNYLFPLNFIIFIKLLNWKFAFLLNFTKKQSIMEY